MQSLQLLGCEQHARKPVLILIKYNVEGDKKRDEYISVRVDYDEWDQI